MTNQHQHQSYYLPQVESTPSSFVGKVVVWITQVWRQPVMVDLGEERRTREEILSMVQDGGGGGGFDPEWSHNAPPRSWDIVSYEETEWGEMESALASFSFEGDDL